MVVWALTAVLLAKVSRGVPWLGDRVREHAGPAVAFAAIVAVVGLVVYPIFDERRSTGAGSDADDAVMLVIDRLREGVDPYAADTYLGNPPTAGPGSVIWFWPWSTRATYPIGIALAVGATVAVLRLATGRWSEATLFALFLGVSVPFWEGVGQGSDHIPFACSLVVAAAVLDRRRPAPPVALAVVAGAVVGVLATSRAVFLFVPAVAAATLWWRDRRAALAFGVTGTAIAVALHATFIRFSGWDGYAPVQQLLVKSDEDLDTLGRVIVAAGIATAAVAVLLELRRRAESRVDVALLLAVGGPMVSIAVAGLLTAAEPADWSEGSYFLDSVALAAWALAAAMTAAGSLVARASP